MYNFCVQRFNVDSNAIKFCYRAPEFFPEVFDVRQETWSWEKNLRNIYLFKKFLFNTKVLFQEKKDFHKIFSCYLAPTKKFLNHLAKLRRDNVVINFDESSENFAMCSSRNAMLWTPRKGLSTLWVTLLLNIPATFRRCPCKLYSKT